MPWLVRFFAMAEETEGSERSLGMQVRAEHEVGVGVGGFWVRVGRLRVGWVRTAQRRAA